MIDSELQRPESPVNARYFDFINEYNLDKYKAHELVPEITENLWKSLFRKVRRDQSLTDGEIRKFELLRSKLV